MDSVAPMSVIGCFSTIVYKYCPNVFKPWDTYRGGSIKHSFVDISIITSCDYKCIYTPQHL